MSQSRERADDFWLEPQLVCAQGMFHVDMTKVCNVILGSKKFFLEVLKRFFITVKKAIVPYNVTCCCAQKWGFMQRFDQVHNTK